MRTQRTSIKQMLQRYPEIGIGIFIITLMGMIALLAPWITAYKPTDLTDAVLTSPSQTHYFGTDNLGRDIFSMVIYGTRTSLSIGITAAFISTVLGIFIGAVSGYLGGWFDRVVSELIHIFMMTPSFFLIIIVVAMYGSSLRNIIWVIALTSWTGTARMMRSQVVALKERTFVKALITLGENPMKILWRHIVPNGIYPIITDATTSISSAILYESSLSFLGLGDPSLPSWGRMIYNGKSYLVRGWWVALFSGLFLVMTVFAFHLIAEGLNRMTSPLEEEVKR